MDDGGIDDDNLEHHIDTVPHTVTTSNMNDMGYKRLFEAGWYS